MSIPGRAPAPDPAGALRTATGVLQDALSPLPAATSVWVSSPVRDLPAADGRDELVGAGART